VWAPNLAVVHLNSELSLETTLDRDAARIGESSMLTEDP